MECHGTIASKFEFGTLFKNDVRDVIRKRKSLMATVEKEQLDNNYNFDCIYV